MAKVKIGIALSGGVDSTVAAALLLRQGFEVHGYHMRLPLPDGDQQDRLRQLAQQLAIPMHFLDFRDFFSATVIRYFLETYQQGLTPNPCIYCNQTVKFGRLLEAMLADGMELLATGHYAGIREKAGPHVVRGSDRTKDQSYFLCRLRQEQLERMVLPLGGMVKREVYRLAGTLGFPHVPGQESQDVCFLAGHDLASFFGSHHLEGASGTIVSSTGQVLGRHAGIWQYTVGQRRGLGLPDATPWYVVGVNAATNQVVVGKEAELWQRRLSVRDVAATGREFALPWRGLVQLRSRHRPMPALVTDNIGGGWNVLFDEDQRAITPGQYAALYEDDMLVASGIICAAP